MKIITEAVRACCLSVCYIYREQKTRFAQWWESIVDKNWPGDWPSGGAV